MYEYTWYQWISFFFIYCFFGWIFESVYVSLKERKFVNRGFLRLPLLPLYGTGAVMMLLVSLPLKSSLISVYFAGVLAATLLEYITGYMMERLFKMKYWDYSNQKFNLQGYICLSSSIAWGFLTIFLTEVIHSPIESFVLNLPMTANLTALSLMGILFLADTAQSVKAALDLGRMLEAMTKMKAEMEELQLQLSLFKSGTLQKMSDLKEEGMQMAANIRGETSLKFYTFKKEAELKAAAKKEAISQKTYPNLSEVNSRLLSLAENRGRLMTQLNFYRRSLLKGNPTASSRYFNESLKELKRALTIRVKEKRDDEKRMDAANETGEQPEKGK